MDPRCSLFGRVRRFAGLLDSGHSLRTASGRKGEFACVVVGDVKSLLRRVPRNGELLRWCLQQRTAYHAADDAYDTRSVQRSFRRLSALGPLLRDTSGHVIRWPVALTEQVAVGRSRPRPVGRR